VLQVHPSPTPGHHAGVEQHWTGHTEKSRWRHRQSRRNGGITRIE